MSGEPKQRTPLWHQKRLIDIRKKFTFDKKQIREKFDKENLKDLDLGNLPPLSPEYKRWVDEGPKFYGAEDSPFAKLPMERAKQLFNTVDLYGQSMYGTDENLLKQLHDSIDLVSLRTSRLSIRKSSREEFESLGNNWNFVNQAALVSAQLLPKMVGSDHYAAAVKQANDNFDLLLREMGASEGPHRVRIGLFNIEGEKSAELELSRLDVQCAKLDLLFEREKALKNQDPPKRIVYSEADKRCAEAVIGEAIKKATGHEQLDQVEGLLKLDVVTQHRPTIWNLFGRLPFVGKTQTEKNLEKLIKNKREIVPPREAEQLLESKLHQTAPLATVDPAKVPKSEVPPPEPPTAR